MINKELNKKVSFCKPKMMLNLKEFDDVQIKGTEEKGNGKRRI